MHFPWCLKKCPYCDFLSVASEPSAIDHRRYADAVIAELGARARWLAPGRVGSVFFGGGTPSLWEPRELGRVLSAVVERLDVDADAEVTVECNPTSFDASRAEALAEVGVNRVSLGVQSLDAKRLAFLGRLHDGPGALEAVETAIASAIPRVSADLIFGVSDQSAESAVHEATRVADLGPTHLSVYALTIEPGTQFGALARKGRLPLCPDELVADTFEALHDVLTARRFEHYEISNYARDGHVARHNLGYWRGDDYVGLGCGAWGTVTPPSGRVRYRNTPDPDRYVASASAWRGADLGRTGELVSEVERIDAETALRERLMLGLRTAEGVDVEAAAAELAVDPWPAKRAAARDRLLDDRRLATDGQRYWVPPEAWLVADGTIAALL